MKAKELMIGDWFQTTYPNGKIEYRKVDAVHSGYVDSKDGVTNAVEPIPLTPEILEKNRFVLKSDGWIWCKEEGIEEQNYIFVQFRKEAEEVRICELNFVGRVQATYRNLHFVHQLQHALRLCGIKKEIQL